jgi:PAS domain-containing protein
MLTENMKESEAADLHAGNVSPAGNPSPGNIHRVTCMAGKLLADSTTRKNLIVLILVSVFAFLIAADTGLFGGIESWERINGLSNYHLGEFAILLMVLGVAITIFLYRRYEQIREESLDETASGRDLSPEEIWAGFQYEQLESLFHQVEAAKKEWQLSVDSIKEMVLLSDLDGRIHRCNRAFRDFTGLPYEEILMENFASLLARFGVDMRGLDLKTLNARLHVSGKWFGVRSYPYQDFETGNITRVVIMMLDVSGRKVADEKIQFLWGHKVYTRCDGGKESPSPPPEPATRATN